MNSMIYRGSVSHHRLLPVKNAFRYPYYFYLFDLDELDTLDRSVRGFGYNRMRLASIHDKDYLAAEKGTIKEKLFLLLAREGLAADIRHVKLLTSARYLNHVFNPVSFYYCFGPDNGIRCIVAEVNNTFGEKYVYILKQPFEVRAGYMVSTRAEKKFFVSPFFAVEGEYAFRFSEPGRESLEVRIEYARQNRLFFTARLQGRGEALTTASLFRVVCSMPFRALLSLPLIHWQAAKLFFLKKLKIIGRPHAKGPYVLRETYARIPDKFFIGRFLSVLAAARSGSLVLRMPDGREYRFGGAAAGPAAEIVVHNYWFFIKTGLFGDVGFGDAYVEGLWDSPDVTALLGFFVANMEYLEKKIGNLRLLNMFTGRGAKKRQNNTVSQARDNISAHYDLSNEFFKLFLDSNMVYSSAFYETGTETLEEAQLKKIRRIIAKADIRAGDRVLEIGSGWGAFAREAVRAAGCTVTTVTVSREQFEHVRATVAREGLADKIDVRLCDYRDIDGVYDKIVSIEMIEAVGHEYMERFFVKCDALLKDGGLFAAQVITIPDDKYERYRKNHDWIREHIFPGGLLPSVGLLVRSARKTRLSIVDTEDIADSYARTLGEWKARLAARKGDLFKLGFDETFFRKWDYYLSYSQAALGQRYIQDLQIVWKKG